MPEDIDSSYDLASGGVSHIATEMEEGLP